MKVFLGFDDKRDALKARRLIESNSRITVFRGSWEEFLRGGFRVLYLPRLMLDRMNVPFDAREKSLGVVSLSGDTAVQFHVPRFIVTSELQAVRLDARESVQFLLRSIVDQVEKDEKLSSETVGIYVPFIPLIVSVDTVVRTLVSRLSDSGDFLT